MNHDAGRAAGTAMSEPLTAEALADAMYGCCVAAGTIEHAQHVIDRLTAAALEAARPSGVDVRAIVEALGFDPTNHHNAAKCPYCSPARPPGEIDDIIHDPGCRGGHTEEEQCATRPLGEARQRVLAIYGQTWTAYADAVDEIFATLDGRREEGA